MSTLPPRRPLVFVVVVSALTLAACGGTPTSAKDSGNETTTSSTSAPSPYPGVDPGHLVPTPPGPTTVPTEQPTVPVYPGFNTGQQALITAHGFEPKQLDALTDQPVVWTNVSGAPQRVLISQENVRSPVIPPGAQFVWTWKSGGNINVQSASGFSQSLYYQQ